MKTPYRGNHFGAFSSNGGSTWYVAGIDASGSHHQKRGSLTKEQANECARLADEAASQIDCPEAE